MQEIILESNSSTEESSSGISATDFSKISFTEDPSRKPAFNFMDKRENCRVVYNGVDVTPDNIVCQDYVTMEDVYTHAAYDSKPRYKSEIGLKASKSKTMSKSGTDTAMKVYATTINLDDIHIDHTINTEEGYVTEDRDLEVAPSAFYLPKEYPPTSYPSKILVMLKETNTVFLFDLPSYSYDKGSSEGNIAEEENEYYQYITVGKGRNRKMVVEETQTKFSVTQTRHTLAVRPEKKNAVSFASMWDMHDTYAQQAIIQEEEKEDEMVLYQTAGAHLLRKKKKKLAIRRGKRFDEILETPQFMDAILLTERVLATRQYGNAQKIFRGLSQFNPLALDLIYIYSMKPLWTLECEETANRPITSISFNPKNENILAVGYGKFSYAGQYTGIVCVWCTKNPCVPERLYRFPEPITSVCFAEKNPNWLACGFTNGDVIILDVTSYPVKTIARSKRETNPCFDPIWKTSWRTTDQDSEYVMTACQDGRINKFVSTETHDLICSPMMRISTVEGKMKGLEIAKTCLKVDVPITRYPAAMCTKWHPYIDHVYLVGTDEGCIHRCSTHYLNQHIDVYRAHAGPVYGMEYSPFMKTLLVSCGADSAMRLWIEGIDDVIMTLPCFAAVYGVAWCPINATVLISVSGCSLSVWDLRRKNHIPCAEYSFNSHVTLTYVKFSTSGDNVFVGDTTGKIHTFHLEDTPIPPYYQKKMLDEAIRKALCTRPQLLKQLDKLEKFQGKTG